MKSLLKSFVLAGAMMMAAAVPSMTPNANAGEGSAELPYIETAGLSIIVDGNCDSLPSFVAYYLLINRSFVYQGDTGWIDADSYNVTFPQWPYNYLPLVLMGFSTTNAFVPKPTNPGDLRNMGGTRLGGSSCRIESDWLKPVMVDAAE